MCQLTLVNLKNAELNRIFLAPLLQYNSTNNSDGTGFMVAGRKSTSVWKSKVSADCIDNLGIILKDNVSNGSPVLAHVRAASKGIVITDENAHPFKGERFVLAHNGRLYKREEIVSYTNTSDDTGLESDSVTFLNALEVKAKEKPDMPAHDLINATMEDFKGKFALLVYDTQGRDYYVCRGDTADLHIVKIQEWVDDVLTPVGFIINTKKDSLLNSVTVSLQMAQALTGRYFVADKIIELNKETIYKVEKDDLVKLRDIKENKVVYTYQDRTQNTSSWKASQNGPVLPIWRLSERINSFREDHCLDICDIDAMFYIFLGVSLADVELEDLTSFVELVIPKTSATKVARARMSKVLGKGGVVSPRFYKSMPTMQYPWMLNDASVIDRFIASVDQSVKALR